MLVSLFTIYFFRDPERIIPQNNENLIICPADGKIITARKVTQEEVEDYECSPSDTKISIFMNVFNVHVNRAPISGKIIKIKHTKGKKMPAYHEKASKLNEHMDFTIQGKNDIIKFRLIAGLVAQRIKSFKIEKAIVSAGERIGMIKFGSRVDVIIPEKYTINVSLNDKVKAGGTVLATA